ncbi:protein translocase subunit SecDF [Chitinophagales bacterium]|nr:protein translocase subunit SecDF [Chitinophagales bacterium]
MQAKGFIRIVIIALIVVSIFQLSFTFIKNSFVGQAEEYAQSLNFDVEDGLEKAFLQNKAKNYYLDSIKNEEVFLGFTFDEINKRSLNLGLDLKGGVSMLVEIDQADVLKKLSNNTKDENFNNALAAAVAAQSQNQGNFIALFGKEYEKIAGDAKLAGIFAPIEKFREKISFDSSNEEVLKVLQEEASAKNSETHNVLTTRIDEFGVAQPFISEPDANGRIYIELPGADNTDRVRNIIQSAAVLEFYETVDASVAGNLLFQSNDILVGVLGLEESAEEAEEALETIESEEVIEDAPDAEEDVEESDLNELEADLFGDDLAGLESLEEDSSAANAFNPLFDVLQPNIDVQDGRQFWRPGAVVGYVAKKDMEKVKEYLAMEEIKAIFDLQRIKIAWAAKPFKGTGENANDFYALFALQKGIDGKSALSGDVITDARSVLDEFGAAAVSMRMNNVGANKWSILTEENIGNQIAIVLDDKVFSAPNVMNKIAGGSSQITGLDDFDEAKDLANILKSGRLDAQINIPQEAVVGASLGDASIRSGLLALGIGFLLVILFMVMYYSNAGIIANIALLVNIVFIMGTLASLGAALTLPGLAGIVLTIGMAVDANVIIFERIKEELRKGKGARLAISDGFSRSYSAIIDANVTTFITAATLLWLGAGPVKGFAIVLMIGIIASFISAVFLSRLIFDAMSDRDKQVKVSMSWSENILKDANFDFLGKRKITYAISAVIILAGLVSMFTKGFELGVDFKGGRSYVVAFDQTVGTDAIRSDLSDVLGATPQVKTFGNDQTVQIITSYAIESKDPKTDSTVTHMLYDALKGEFVLEPSKEEFMRSALIQSNKVDTSIADDIKTSAFWAGGVGAVLIFLYLLIRFRKWQYGVGALGAVIHDSLILLSVFSIFWGEWFPFSLEIEQKFIAAILTVIGYSINDTVIVFDRIREYFDEHPTKDILTNVNAAINSTLSRTLMTSFTTLLVVLILFIFGGEAIRGFSFALLLGILVGTYSSIFIASAIVVDTMKSVAKVKKK